MIDACLSAFWGCFQIRAKYYYPFFHVGCICNSVGSTLTSLLDFRCRFFVIGCSWCRNKSQHAESLLATPRSFAATTRSYQQALGSSGLLESWENDAMGNGQGWNDSTPPNTHGALRLNFLQLHLWCFLLDSNMDFPEVDTLTLFDVLGGLMNDEHLRTSNIDFQISWIVMNIPQIHINSRLHDTSCFDGSPGTDENVNESCSLCLGVLRAWQDAEQSWTVRMHWMHWLEEMNIINLPTKWDFDKFWFGFNLDFQDCIEYTNKILWLLWDVVDVIVVFLGFRTTNLVMFGFAKKNTVFLDK